MATTLIMILQQTQSPALCMLQLSIMKLKFTLRHPTVCNTYMILQQAQSPSIKYVISSASSPPKCTQPLEGGTQVSLKNLCKFLLILGWSRIYEKIHAKTILTDQALKK